MGPRETILGLLEKDSRLTAERIAVQTGLPEADVAAEIAAMEREKVILAYGAVVDWEKTDRDPVTALIEVRITPQRGQGFDRIAQRIYSYPEVRSCYLMSGGFDLMVIIEDDSLKSVARFVSERIAPLESVITMRSKPPDIR
jgi:DNA-binding Lrp family transcriptional regulator